MSWPEAILVAASLCADCFAVTLCSSVTVRRLRPSGVALIAISFAIIQTSLLLGGWAFGKLLAPLVIRLSHIIGFLLLLFVGGSMLLEGIRGEEKARDLGSLKNIVLGGIATSIDAFAVGASMSIEGQPWSGSVPLAVCVFAITALSAAAGIVLGKTIGAKTGRAAEIAGGLVLIGIGISVLL